MRSKVSDMMIKWLLFGFAFFQMFSTGSAANANGTSEQSLVPIGVILDLSSTTGAMVEAYISMAIEDFYREHPYYRTKLAPQTRDARDILNVVSAASELLKNNKVHGIVGSQPSEETKFIAELGNKVQIPIISFSARTHFAHKKPSYFIRTTPDESYQVKALANLCQKFQWSEVIVLYEDNTASGNQFLYNLGQTLHTEDIYIRSMISIPNIAEDPHIFKELQNLAALQTRVFIVHMNSELGSRLFILARKAGMMTEGYAWIITDKMSTFIDDLDPSVIDSMEGVLGIRPYVPKTKNVKSFKTRWKKKLPALFGLWVYDTIYALAMAVEKVQPAKNITNSSDFSNLSISASGPCLLTEILSTNFKGLSGNFQFRDGELVQPSTIEIFFVVGTTSRTIGYWTQDKGLIRELGSHSGAISSRDLKKVIWPGDSVIAPKGWAIPSTGKLRVGVPKKEGFTEFVQVQNLTGFCIDIFLAALPFLPFQIDYEFHPFVNETGQSNGSYNDMLHKIPEIFDMVVGDTTILDARAAYVDFSLPFTESGIVMVVKCEKKHKDMWIFLKPLTWDLWLTIAMTCIFIGVVIRILEHRVNLTGTDPMEQCKQQLGMSFWFPIAVLAFPERNMVTNHWSIFVLVIWILMAFILMQSYTANLSAILTVKQLKSELPGDCNVGTQVDTFVGEFLQHKLHFNKSRLKEYATMEEYHEAMQRGSKNGGIDVIFDEMPYMKLLLERYPSEYKIAGQTYRSAGFGFAFKKGSPLVPHFSRAILNVTQGDNMSAIEKKNFGLQYSSDDQLSLKSEDNRSLTTYSFGGLFILVGAFTIFALLCSETSIGQRFVEMITTCNQRFWGILLVKSARVSAVDNVHENIDPNTQSGDGSDGNNDDENKS